MSSRITDEQFGRLYELLKLCEGKGIDLSVRHRIANEVAHSGNIDLRLQNFQALVEKGHIPTTSGIPKKISLLSSNLGYGPIPADDEEVEQRLTINDRGNVYITYYNFHQTALRKEWFNISAVIATQLIQDINTTFAIRTEENEVLDVGTWELTITNTNDQTFNFRGPVYLDWESVLTNLSESIRELLDRPMLYAFDGNAEEKLQFVSVCFDFGGQEYSYLAEGMELYVGDTVEVPVGNHDRRTIATVVAIEYCTEADAPYPVEDIKRVIRKVEPELPSNLTGTPFDIVKRVVDALDPEGLLEMEAPPDEYDGESRVIANSLKPGMSADKIAYLMAEEFSRSFSDPFDPNYFMVAAVRIKEALEVQNKKEPDEEVKNE